MTRSLRGLISPLLAVAGAAVLGGILAVVIGENPLRAAQVLAEGLTTPDGLGNVLFNATALTLTGLSVAFAFRAGLFNIGAEGQLVVGAFAASITALHLPGAPRFLLGPLCILAAAAAGAVWGAIPGLLRARLGVHEVINTIMMNFIASGLTGYLTVHIFKEPGQMIPQTSVLPEAAWIPRLGDLPLVGRLVPASSPANSALFLALGAAGVVAWVLYRTPLGFRVRAIGQGERAAQTSGVPTGMTLVAAMAVAGALAGLAGVNEALGFRHRYLDNFSSGVGFLGIAVALLGRVRVAGVVAAALLFGVLNAGAVEIDLFTGIPQELMLVVQAGILLFVVAGDEVSRRLIARRARRKAESS
ncbi:MAG: ABC transporter permease [Gemmatimonadota bacterium]|jgi:simple sugar transport system permease protein|nr:ABC transporter permease [Gemmatimonadota bacterium]